MTVTRATRQRKRAAGTSGNGREALFSGIPGSFPLVLLALLIALVTVPMSYLGHEPVKPTPPPPRPQIETRIHVEGLDQHQRPLPFTVYILSQDLSWKLESVNDLEGEQALLSPELTAAVAHAQDVFCIGTASFEGTIGNEEARAARRARTLARWIGGAIEDPHKTRIFSVNAGQYNGPAQLDSSRQRKAIIIATQGHPDDVNLGQALASGLSKKQKEYPVVYSLLHDYTRSGRWLRNLN
jgi:hypothetical protein